MRTLAIAAAMALAAQSDPVIRPGDRIPDPLNWGYSLKRFGNKKTVSKAQKKARAKLAAQSKRRNRK